MACAPARLGRAESVMAHNCGFIAAKGYADSALGNVSVRSARALFCHQRRGHENWLALVSVNATRASQRQRYLLRLGKTPRSCLVGSLSLCSWP